MKKKILIVDDNTRVNKIVQMSLSYSYETLSAKNGEEAVDLAVTEVPDLIIMDLMMPEMNGFEAARIIRSLERDVPIVALTAVEKEKVILNASSSLFDDFIIKPYKNKDFISLISKYVGVEAF